jgi:hypothetical protein
MRDRNFTPSPADKRQSNYFMLALGVIALLYGIFRNPLPAPFSYGVIALGFVTIGLAVSRLVRKR